MILKYSEWEALFSGVEQAFNDLGVNEDNDCKVLHMNGNTIVFSGNSDTYEITITIIRKEQTEK